MIQVILHRILVEREKPVDTDAVRLKSELDRVGLAMPQAYRDEIDKQANREAVSMDKGTVVKIGSLAFRDYGIECPIKEGDYISYAKFGGKDVVDPETEQTYVVINDEDVVAILTKKEG